MHNFTTLICSITIQAVRALPACWGLLAAVVRTTTTSTSQVRTACTAHQYSTVLHVVLVYTTVLLYCTPASGNQ